MSDSAVLTCGPKMEKSCDLAGPPLVALSHGGTRRPDEVVRAGVCGLTKAWRQAGAVPSTALYASTTVLDLMRAATGSGRGESCEQFPPLPSIRLPQKAYLYSI